MTKYFEKVTIQLEDNCQPSILGKPEGNFIKKENIRFEQSHNKERDRSENKVEFIVLNVDTKYIRRFS